MTEIRRVRLLQIPSDRASAWREAAAAACQASDWTFHVQDRNDPTPVLDPDRSSLTFGWVDHAPEGHVTDWLVQTGRPEQASAILAASMGLSEVDALYEASLRLASATTLAVAGAKVSADDDTVLDIPGLGPIALAASAPTAAPESLDHPLSLFESLPPAHGVKTSWPKRLFRYADTGPATALDGRIELIGRRRLLFNGPHIFLPRGVWRFRGTFSVQPEDKADLLIEWGYGPSAAQLQQVFEAAGYYEIEMQHTWNEVSPADFRITILTPALDGALEFHGGTLERLADLPVTEPV
ncbi:hypothetical protein BH09PSE1_BH09PSE1_07400 [soil metagenome]